MGFNPFKAAEKKAKDAVNSVVRKVLNPAVRKAEDTARGLSSGIERKARQVTSAAEDKIDDVRDDALKSIKQAAHEVEDGLTDKLPELVEDVVEALAEDAAEKAIKEALDNAADVIEMMAPDSFTLIFGIELALVVQGEVCVSVAFPNPAAKLTEIRKWAANPPRGRSQIMDCIRDFGPEALGVEAKVSGNGIAAEWSGEDKYDRVDAFLAKHGVD